MKIAIAGYGQEGKANFEYWNRPENEVTIVDEREQLGELPQGVTTILGEGAFSRLTDFDMVVRTAGLNPAKIVTNGKVWSSTNEFFAKCPAPIIGVTGTKGKGTTCSMIASMLRTAGKNVHLVGNIGVPALSELKSIQASDIVVFELSSFQLWDIEKSPHLAAILRVEQDHLDVHEGMEDYVTAKAQITRYMSANEIVYYHPTSENSRIAAQMYHTASTKRYAIKDDGAVYVQDGDFKKNDEIICSVDVVQIPGEHNIENACAAISVVLDITNDFLAVAEGLQSFTGLEHRLKFIREVDGVKFYDDSYSSAPPATIAAVRAFSTPQVVLIGGYDRNISFTDLANEVKNSSVKLALLFGQTRHKLADAFIEAGIDAERFQVIESTKMNEIVSVARQVAVSGDVVIFSPACASFDMFKNFTDRGKQFISEVNSL